MVMVRIFEVISDKIENVLFPDTVSLKSVIGK